METENAICVEKIPTREMTRYNAYGWLAEEMNLKRKDTHIALFDIDQCKRVIELLNDRKEKHK